MIESFKEIFSEEHKEIGDLDKIMQEKLGIGFSACAQALCESLQQRAEEVTEDVISMAPYGDYDKLTEDPEVISKFLREEASKPENWKIQMVEVKKNDDQLMELVFDNIAVDDGDILKGFVFVGLSGKIRHAFAQIHG